MKIQDIKQKHFQVLMSLKVFVMTTFVQLSLNSLRQAFLESDLMILNIVRLKKSGEKKNIQRPSDKPGELLLKTI